MARKMQYRATSFEQARPYALASALGGAQKLVIAIDVVKTKMMAGFAREDGAVVRLVKWTSPLELRAFVELIMQTARLLNVPLALGEGGQQDASARVRTDLPRHFDSLRSLRGTRHHARAHADA